MYADENGKLPKIPLDNNFWGLYLATFPDEVPRETLKNLAGFVLPVGIAVSPIIKVADSLWRKLLKDDSAAFWKHTTRTWDRSFVFFDVSDFSKQPAAAQLLIITHLIRMANATFAKTPEAELCIGDGYVYVYPATEDAVWFAAQLAHQLEQGIAERSLPEFHFRIGVHTGRVRFFWDPGRDDYNYVGDGINDANRVLTAIGKEVDDVVFVSAAARKELRRVADDAARSGPERGRCHTLLGGLDNKGRRADKHGNLHRVYQLNHTAVTR